MEYKVLTSQFNIDVHSAFCSFCLILNIAQEEPLSHLVDTEYKIVDDDEKDEIAFQYGDPITIHDTTLEGKSYSIFVKNAKLFHLNKYFPLQKLHVDMGGKYWNFAKCLKNKQDKVIRIAMVHETADHYAQVLASIRDSKFVLVCDEFDDAQQITPDKIYPHYYVYTFDAIEDIHFIVPFRQVMDRLRIYVQCKSTFNFVFIKQFNIGYNAQKVKRKYEIAHILQVLKVYDRRITTQQDFFDKVGITLHETDLPLIKKNNIIYEESSFSSNIVLHRLINELYLKNLAPLHEKYLRKKTKESQKLLRSKSTNKTSKLRKSFLSVFAGKTDTNRQNNNLIDRQLDQDRKKFGKVKKILFLGSGGSGV
eukprot:276787_1